MGRSLLPLYLSLSSLCASDSDLYGVPSRRISNGSICTGRGNETSPVGHVRPKKKEFGSRRLSRKERKRSK